MRDDSFERDGRDKSAPSATERSSEDGGFEAGALIFIAAAVVVAIVVGILIT